MLRIVPQYHATVVMMGITTLQTLCLIVFAVLQEINLTVTSLGVKHALRLVKNYTINVQVSLTCEPNEHKLVM